MTDVYQNRYKSDKVAACKAIAQNVADGEAAAAELGINLLLKALYDDYAACVGGAFGTQDLDNCKLNGGASVDRAAVVTFAQATCDLFPALAQTGDVDCVVPSAENLQQPTIPASDNDPAFESKGGWKVAGPLSQGDTFVLPSGELAVQLDALVVGADGNVFVSVKELPPGNQGICPAGFASNFDCAASAYAIDVDAGVSNDPVLDSANGGLGGLYVEICESEAPFANVPGRCAGGTCEPANAVAARGLLACSRGALAIAPSTWTPIDDDPASRTVVCEVESTSAAGSEGTICTVRLPDDTPVAGATCVTEATGPKTSECLIPVTISAAGNPPGSAVNYVMTGEKLDGVSHFGSTPFDLSQTDPVAGTVEVVHVDVLPPGQQ